MSMSSDRPMTARDVLKFKGEAVRLPPIVVELLADLLSRRRMLTRATVQVSTEDGQKVADLHLRLARGRGQYFGAGYSDDDLYEALEGAGSERLLIRAHFTDVPAPEHRLLGLDDSELLPTADLPPEDCAAEDEAWLLVTEHQVFTEKADDLFDVLEVWEEGGAASPRLQYVKLMQGDRYQDFLGIELPLSATLKEARVLAARLGEAVGAELTVHLAPRQARYRSGTANQYESVRDMARRLRRTS